MFYLCVYKICWDKEYSRTCITDDALSVGVAVVVGEFVFFTWRMCSALITSYLVVHDGVSTGDGSWGFFWRKEHSLLQCPGVSSRDRLSRTRLLFPGCSSYSAHWDERIWKVVWWKFHAAHIQYRPLRTETTLYLAPRRIGFQSSSWMGGQNAWARHWCPRLLLKQNFGTESKRKVNDFTISWTLVKISLIYTQRTVRVGFISRFLRFCQRKGWILTDRVRIFH